MEFKKISFLLFIPFLFSCANSINSKLATLQSGKAIIEFEDGKFSEPMATKEAFSKLESNQKLHLSKGRVTLTEPLKIENLQNIEIIGNDAALVAIIDMPIITFSNSKNIAISNLLVVHEIGEWCAQNCIEFYETSDIEVRNCKFDGSGYFGLALTKVQNAVIENNQFFNCEYGLASWGSANLTVKNNRFYKNRSLDIMSNERTQFANEFEKENEFED